MSFIAPPSYWWAKRGRKIVGPHGSRQEALDAFRAKHPFTGPEYMASTLKNQIMTGYGALGPYYDLQWSDAR